MADAPEQDRSSAPGETDEARRQRQADDLRRSAEQSLDDILLAAATAAAAASPPLPVPEELTAAVHELRVHQIELEMQNEELRRAQLELDEQRRKYFELFDLAPVGYLTLSAQAIVQDANLTAARLLGVERQLLVGRPFTAFVWGLDRDVFYRHRHALQETGEPQSYELRLRRAGGDAATAHFWAQLEGRAQQKGDGEPPSCWLTFTDIDTRKKAEGALQASEERFAALFQEAPLAYQSLDEDGRFIDVNSAWLETLGYARDDVIGTWFGDYLAPECVDGFRERFPLFKARGAIHSEFLMLRTDGGTRAIAFEGRIGRHRDGSFKQTHCILVDITERKAAEEAIKRLNDELEDRVLARTAELKAANQELEAFVYSVSHDLRAPLRAIDGFSEMIAEDAAERLDGDDLEHLQRVRAAAQRMGLLIDHLLALSRATRKDLLCEPVDLSATALSVLADLRRQAPERSVETVVQPHLVVDADATLLRVILANLLGNAWKFTSEHGSARIEVGVTDGDGERAFYVRDDGAGFDMGRAEHLFGAFQRLHTAEEFEGDGIGLATVQRLVARHGGRVWAEGEVEKGATFFFTLPDPAPEGPAKPAPTSA